MLVWSQRCATWLLLAAVALAPAPARSESGPSDAELKQETQRLLPMLARAADDLARARAESGPMACFDAEPRREIEALLPELALSTDDLARSRAEAGDSGLLVYAMARQTRYAERLSRHIAERDDGLAACLIALDRMARDLQILRRVAQALKDGDREIDIARLGDAEAQRMLADQLQRIADIERVSATLKARD